MFKSTLKTELYKRSDGVYDIRPQEYPLWYGIPNIGFIYINHWADPDRKSVV